MNVETTKTPRHKGKANVLEYGFSVLLRASATLW